MPNTVIGYRICEPISIISYGLLVFSVPHGRFVAADIP